MSRMEAMKIRRAKRLCGTIRVPGDKSISHRAAILAAMCTGEMRIESFSLAGDCQTTLQCLEQIGVNISRRGTAIGIEGVGKNGFRPPVGPLDCGNSGTTARLLAGLLAGQEFDSEITGDASLRSRPMKRIIEPLSRMEARIESADGHLPMTIHGGHRLRGFDHKLPVASAQVKSCLLIAGLLSAGKTSVLERTPTRDHTERMLQWLGVDVETTLAGVGQKISVSGEAILTARDIGVPGDISSAAYFIIAAAILPGSDIVIPDIGLNPLRKGIIDVLLRAGADIQITELGDKCNEPVGTVRVVGGISPGSGVQPIRLSGADIPGIIDELPVLAVLGTQVEGGIEVCDAGELRLKETDRITAVVENLRRMNARVEEFPDGFKVERSTLKGALVDSFGDHRIAMAFAVAGLAADGETEIAGADCADISFPGYFEALDRSVERLDG